MGILLGAAANVVPYETAIYLFPALVLLCFIYRLVRRIRRAKTHVYLDESDGVKKPGWYNKRKWNDYTSSRVYLDESNGVQKPGWYNKQEWDDYTATRVYLDASDGVKKPGWYNKQEWDDYTATRVYLDESDGVKKPGWYDRGQAVVIRDRAAKQR